MIGLCQQGKSSRDTLEMGGAIDFRSDFLSLDSVLFQFLHRGSKNFRQNSRTLTGETKVAKLAPAVQT